MSVFSYRSKPIAVIVAMITAGGRIIVAIINGLFNIFLKKKDKGMCIFGVLLHECIMLIMYL